MKKPWIIGALVIVTLTWLWFSGSENTPELTGSQLRIGTVKRGLLVREIRGHGSFQPANPHFVTALSEGVVSKVHVRPGDRVVAETVLLTLENPGIIQIDQEATLEVASAEAALEAEQARHQRDRLAQAAAVSLAELKLEEANILLNSQRALFEKGIVAEISLKEAEIRLKEWQTRLSLEKRSQQQLETLIKAEGRAREKQLSQLRKKADLQRKKAELLTVLAGTEGVIQECPWRSGQQVDQGERIARIAKPEDLQAELQIPETQAREVVFGMKVRVGTRGTQLAGTVMRIAPVASNGTILIEVQLIDPLPTEARPDLTVDGYIELERLEEVLYIDRPAFGAANETVAMFRIDDTRENLAKKTEVTFGAASYRTIQIADGLKENDRVILSDTPGHQKTQEIRIR